MDLRIHQRVLQRRPRLFHHDQRHRARQLQLQRNQWRQPLKGLVQTADGKLYGTATKKGTTSGGGAATGVIYTISGLPPKR
jgi:hypothetical protein